MLVLSRQQAIASGGKRYFLGTPCKNGHIAERWVTCCACVECKKERTRTYLVGWREKNQEKHNAASREWAVKNAEYSKKYKALKYQKNKPDVLEKAKSYYQKKRCAVLERVAQYREKNAEFVRAGHRSYYQRNKEMRRASNHTIRAQRSMAVGRHSKVDILKLKTLQRNKCACCRKTLSSYHIDHIQALSKGGSNWPENLQLLCPNCNQRKSNKHPIDFMQQNGFLL